MKGKNLGCKVLSVKMRHLNSFNCFSFGNESLWTLTIHVCLGLGIMQSAENRRKECHRFWLRLRHAVVLISNDRTSASKKINGMALITTLTVSTTAFERTKNKFNGFRQTVWIL